jgi:hypothetical protein
MASKKQRAEYFGGAMTALCELMSTFGISRETTEMQFSRRFGKEDMREG